MSHSTTQLPRRRGLPRAVRRQLTIDTTLQSLARHGAEGTSLRSVSRAMGVAPALITHCFSGWNEVLTASYTTLSERFIDHLTQLPTLAFTTESDRAAALIDRYIATDWAGEPAMAAMIAFWQLSRSQPGLSPLFGRFLETRQRVVSGAIGTLAEDAGRQIDADEVATCLILMMDGVWLHMSLSPDAFPPGQARSLCQPWLAARLGMAAPTR